MGKRSTAERIRVSEERRAAKVEVRRRELRERYPDIAPQAWSNLGDGLGGVGGKGLREWLTTIYILTLKCHTLN